MNGLQIFEYDGRAVRTVLVDGNPWWVLKDVCGVLGLGNTTRVAERLDEDELSQIHLTDSLGRQQETYTINESGLYSVLLRSDKPQAKPFRKWVTSEVLPEIRKTGHYQIVTAATTTEQRPLTTDDYLKAAQIVSNCRNERLPYVLGFLEQAGFSTPRLTEADSESTNEALRLIQEAKQKYGLTHTQIGKLIGLDKVQVSRYCNGQSVPRPKRAACIVSQLSDALSQLEQT